MSIIISPDHYGTRETITVWDHRPPTFYGLARVNTRLGEVDVFDASGFFIRIDRDMPLAALVQGF